MVYTSHFVFIHIMGPLAITFGHSTEKEELNTIFKDFVKSLLCFTPS